MLRHAYLEASPIPGVDYGRSPQQTKTLFIPDEYMKRLAEGGFVVFGAQSVEGSAQEMPSVQDFGGQPDAKGKGYQVVNEANEAAEDAEEVASSKQSQQSSPNLLPIPPTSMYQLHRVASDDELARQAGGDDAPNKASPVCGRFLAHEARTPTRRVTVPKVAIGPGAKTQMNLPQPQDQPQSTSSGV